MREIKFRAYNKKRKEIYSVFSLSTDYVFKDTMDGIGCHGVPDKGEDVYLMQYTGLKDKHEKEIYDGDIIGDWNDVDGKRIQSKFQVFWNNFTSSYHLDNSYNQDKSSSIELWQELNDFQYEILGNIYENSEFIK